MNTFIDELFEEITLPQEGTGSSGCHHYVADDEEEMAADNHVDKLFEEIMPPQEGTGSSGCHHYVADDEEDEG